MNTHLRENDAFTGIHRGCKGLAYWQTSAGRGSHGYSLGVPRRFVHILLIFLFFCHGCGGGSSAGSGEPDPSSNVIPPEETLASLQIKPAAAVLKAGKFAEFELVATTESGKTYFNVEAEWTLDRVDVATFQSGQKVYASGSGTAVLLAQRDGVQINPVDIIVPSDPLFFQQWHLKNVGQNGGLAGIDVNVEPVWRGGIKGQLTHVAVVDDGIEIGHVDLVDNAVESKSWNYLRFKNDPTSGVHGTAVAGIIAARDGNNIGGAGIAPRVGLSGFNLLENYNTINEADAMLRHADIVAVSNNSWGAIDSTGELFRANDTWQQAVKAGAQQGRGGLGLVYVWAGGNGGRFEVDNSNFDGQANNRYVIAVSAIGDDGVRAGYSEQGANLWLTAPSRGYSGQGLVTTDRSQDKGFNASNNIWDLPDKNFTQFFSGTSASAPMVAGVAALVLDANPKLSWRDVRVILARTATKNDAQDSDWTVNRAPFGYAINHKYGFGMVNGYAAVQLALNWQPIGPELLYESEIQWVNRPIADNSTVGESAKIYVPQNLIVDYVTVVFDASDHESQGDLEVTLESPAGTQSILAHSHLCRNEPCGSRYINWQFGTVRHLEENALGEWNLTVKDLRENFQGTFRSWSLQIYGRSGA